MEEKQRSFLGTYFDRDAVLRWARIVEVLAWVVAAIYAVDFIVGVTTFALQFARGFMVGWGTTDILQNALYILERPVHGVLYFAVLQVLSKGLQIALDMEANTRATPRT